MEPYLIVSTDSHVGPKLREQLRDYCPKNLLDEFDAFVEDFEKYRIPNWEDVSRSGGTPFSDAIKARTAENTATAGVYDPHQRVRDMDSEGVAAEVVYHGAMTPEVIPFSARYGRISQFSRELQAEGLKIYNRWLADFVSVAPDRFIGAIHLPMWDIETSVKEVEWAAENGLKCINFPAPNRSLPDYNSPEMEPFWAAVASTGLPLTTHGGSGDMPPYSGPEAWALYMSDLFFYSRRALHYMVWSGVFERYPELKYVFVEQRSEWVPDTLAHLDSIYYSEFHDFEKMIPRPPSEYFNQNCYVASSFMSRAEAEARHNVGVDRFMWGTDYPHYEGTWGYTPEAMRYTFAGLPVEDLRKILGDNAVRVFNLDGAKLREIADRIGPKPEDVDVPLPEDEIPEIVGCSFRKHGTWS